MRICCAGEVMVEMAATPSDGTYRRNVAGDSFNTAVYLARAGLQVDYLTRLGDDAMSDDILRFLELEQIGTSLIERCPGRQPGLYLINNDPDGERHFLYWRDRAPAREMFSKPLQLPAVDIFYFTGITLAVTRDDLQQLVDLLGTLRERGCRIIFDPNYRSALWRNIEEAREHYRAVLPLCHVALPSLEDETALWGPTSMAQCRARYLEQGIEELVIKGDALTTLAIADGNECEQTANPVVALDTTGAGDAFNAGYLAARLTGADLATALTRAQQLAAAVVQHRGAILPLNDLSRTTG